MSPSQQRPVLHEAAHKLVEDGHQQIDPSEGEKPSMRRSLNEAAEPSEALKAAADDQRDVVAHAGRVVLALGALGIVYGDIGTSPLYTEHVIFGSHSDAAHATPAGVYGVISLIFWALMIVVSLKYAVIIMRAHNRGDGGIMALTALIQRRRMPRTALLVTLGLLGAG